MLFNLHVENKFADALEGTELGIKVNDRTKSKVHYADDIVIITDNIELSNRLIAWEESKTDKMRENFQTS